MTDLARLPARAPSGAVHVVVESPRGSRLKLKWDPGLDAFGLSRPLPLGLAYPYDWGFVPGTRAQDGDPLDALVYWDQASHPGIVLACRAIGAVMLEHDRRSDGARVRNDRLLVVPVKDERATSLESALDLPGRVRDEIEKFFLDAIFFEPKNPRMLGWCGPDDAEALVDAAALGLGGAGRRAGRVAMPRRRVVRK